MTQAEWIAAFCPIGAKACPEHEAVTHSLRKWEGIAWAMENESKFVLPINHDSETCALCQHHYDPAPEAEIKEQPCVRCPLAISLPKELKKVAVLFPSALKESAKNRPLTEAQLGRLKLLGFAVGWWRPKGSHNMIAKGLELRGLVTREDYGDCRITDAGRVYLNEIAQSQAAT